MDNHGLLQVELGFYSTAALQQMPSSGMTIGKSPI